MQLTLIRSLLCQFTVHFNGSGDTRKGVCLCMSVADLMERIAVNEVLMYVSVHRMSHLSLTRVRLSY